MMKRTANFLIAVKAALSKSSSYIKKALAKPQLVFKPKRPGFSSQD
jgi:hypothetical protein